MHYLEQKETEDGIMTFKVAISILFILIEALKSIASLTLVCWHIFLKKIGITTYQYLVEKEELTKLKVQLESQKISIEVYEKDKQLILDARQVRSVHKIKKSNVITPVGKFNSLHSQPTIEMDSGKTIEERLAKRRALR